MAYQKFQSDYAGQPLIVETGHIAEQANGALFIRCRDVVVLVTATANRTPREGIDFFPLTCDYEEKLYSVGRIPGSFPRREGRPSEAGVLASRMIDRPLRPLFPKDFRNDVQIIATVVSADQEQDPTTLAVTGASLALAISDIPHAGPVGCVRVGMLDGQLMLNPTLQQIAESELDLVVAGTADAISMVEAGARQVNESVMLQAMRMAHDEIKRLVQFQLDIRDALGAKPTMNYPPVTTDAAVAAAVHDQVADRIGQAARNVDKATRERQLDDLKNEVVTSLADSFPEKRADISKAFESETKKAVRSAILSGAGSVRRSAEVRVCTFRNVLRRPKDTDEL